MDAFEWLVVILSSALALLLVLVIYFLYHLIKLMASLRRIGERAEKVATNVEVASQFFKSSASKVAVSRFITNIVDAVKDKEKKPKK